MNTNTQQRALYSFFPFLFLIFLGGGNLVLKNLKLKPEALKFLGIPGLVVKTGLLGSLTLRIPWNKLGSEPVIVEFDRIYVLATLDASGKGSLYEEEEEADKAARTAKKRRIESAVTQRLSSAVSSEDEKTEEDDKSGGGYFNRIIQTVLGNLQIIITNLHIRLEDSYWRLGIDFTIEELSGITVNEKGEPDFVSSAINEKLIKRFKLRKLTLYIDPNSKEMTSESPWEDMNVLTWDNFFLPHIKAEDPEITKHFFLKPVNADLIYNRSKSEEKGGETEQSIKLTFEDLGICAFQSQYLSVQRMLQTFEVVSARAPYSHIRPHCTVKTSPGRWWRYAYDALCSSGLVRERISVKDLVGWNSKRKHYVTSYLQSLKDETKSEASESSLEELEEDLHEKTVVFFRCLAIGEHKRQQLERKKSQGEGSGGWLWGWGSRKKEIAEEDDPLLTFDNTDWEKLESVYMEGASDGSSPDGKSGGILSGRTYVVINIVSTSLQLCQNQENDVLLGNINDVKVEATYIGGLLNVNSSVESYLLESKGLEIMKNGAISSDTKAFSLTVEQTNSYERQWTHVQANIAPSFIEVSKPSIEDILVYFSAHDKGARLTTLGMQASAAAQEIGKTTAEQLQVAIASRPLFTFSLDLQAPKIAVSWGDSEQMKTLIVNLGRIVISSEESKDDTVWQRIRARLSDTEVYLTETELKWKDLDINHFTDCESLDVPKSALLPKFGMQLLFQYGDLSLNESQMSLDLTVPDFCLYFSPMVIYNALNLVQYYAALSNVFDSEDAWETADLSDYVQIAITSDAAGVSDGLLSPIRGGKRQGITMNWIHSCKIYLKDDVLYADIPGNSLSRSIFLGRASQILAVPSKFVDDRRNVIIVTESDDKMKQALNMDTSIVISFDNEERKSVWLQSLQFRNEHLKGFGHRQTDSNLFLEEKKPEVQEKTVNFHIHGKLDTFHLFVQGRAYNPAQKGYSIEPFFSFDTRKETELIKVNAKGVSVDLSTSSNGMHLQAMLNSLCVEDLLLGKDYSQCKYLIESHRGRLDQITSSSTADQDIGMIDQEGDVFFDPDEEEEDAAQDSLAIIKFSTSQDEFDGNSSELDVNLSRISVYVNRPTVAALMIIGQDIGYFLNEESPETTEEENKNVSTEVLSLDHDAQSELQDGTFVFKLHMKEAQFILNYEGIKRPLALLRVESLSLNIDLGEQFLLKASLGNLKVADCSVDSTHMYYWAVDVYQSESGSLVDLTLGSVEENHADPTSPNLFIDAHMNSISVVFLNKFLMEILLYIDNLFKYQPEVLGSVPAAQEVVQEMKPLLLKLTIALGAPMIILPRSTSSKDYLELTPGEVKIENKISIYRYAKKDIFVDEMDVLLTGIKCTAYMNSQKGTDILDGAILTVILSRPLNFAETADNRIGVKVLSSELKAKLSKMEYQFVISVAGENFSEEMVFKPNFQFPLPEEETMIVDQNSASIGLQGVSVIVSINEVDVILYSEEGMRSPFASMQIKHLQTYILFDFQDGCMDITVNLPQLKIKDIHDAQNHRVVLCSGSSVSSGAHDNSVDPSLLFLKFRSKGSNSEIDLQLQEPRLVGENTFIMNILDFFVPSAIPEDVLQCTTISDTEYIAESDVYLSPVVRIVAMSTERNEFIYDGNGSNLVLPKQTMELQTVPLILVGPNKTLLIRNTTIVNFSQMSKCTELQANAKIEFQDCVYEEDEKAVVSTEQGDATEESDMKLNVNIFNFHLEFTVDGTDASLSAEGNVDVAFHLAGKSQHLISKVEDLCLFIQERSTMQVESTMPSPDSAKNSITLLQPCTVGVHYVVEEASDLIHIDVSNLNFQLSPMAIHFLVQLQEEILTSLGRGPPERPLMKVLHFNKLVSYEMFPGTFLTFWRPICDVKYASIGDCISFGDEPPAKNVSVVAKGYGMVRKPVSFENVYKDDKVQIWHPIAPEGFVSLGCIVSEAGATPDTSDVHCVHKSLCIPTLTEEYLSPVSSNFSIVNIRNHFGTFIVLSSEHECECLDAIIPSEMVETILPAANIESLPTNIGEEQQEIYVNRKLSRLERESSKPYLRYTVHFRRILQNRRGNYSFWRAIVPEGCYSTGDIAMEGLSPPAKVLCIHESAGDLICKPIKFSLVRMQGKVSIWKPVAPEGYIAFGCILSTGSDSPPIDNTCCVKACYVTKPEVFNVVELKSSKENLYLFTFDGLAKTFIISPDKIIPEEECWVLNFGNEAKEADQKRLIVTTKCGNVKLAISDSVQTPKLKAELVDILLSMEGKDKKTKLTCTFGLLLSSYNSALLSWEPILEKTDLLLKVQNCPSKFDSISLPAELGISLSLTSTMRITIAHACVESMISLLAEWSDMTESGSLFVNQDLNCLNASISNQTGSDFYFLFKYANGSEKVEKVSSSLATQDVLQPFTVPHHLKIESTHDLGNNHVRVKLGILQGTLRNKNPNMCYTISASLEYNDDKIASCLSSRTFGGLDDSVFNCDEMLLIPLSLDLKKLLLTQKLAESDILNVTLHLWQTVHTDIETKRLLAAISYPILAESPRQIREERYPFPLSDGNASGNQLFISFAIDLPQERIVKGIKNASESATYIGATSEGPWISMSGMRPVEMSRNANFTAMNYAGTISPLRMGSSDMILESSLVAGRKLERFRSNIQVYNSLQVAFDIGVKKIVPSHMNVFEVESDPDRIDGKCFVSVFENQRFNVGEGWYYSKNKDQRSKFSTFYGKGLSMKEFPNLPLPLGWEWSGEWVPREVPHLDKNGWCYFKNFTKFEYPPPKSARSKGMLDNVRSRCFIRYCKHTTLTDEELAVISAESNTIIEIGRVEPSEQLVIPKKFCSVGSILELVWRPSTCFPTLSSAAEKVYDWSILVSARSEKMLSLGSMEETSQLMACGQHVNEDIQIEQEPTLFCVSSEGIELSSYSEAVTDWRITLSPVFAFENCTSLESVVHISEHNRGRGDIPTLKSKSPVEPHKSLEISKIDPRKLLSMTFTPEGWEWKKGKEPVFLEDERYGKTTRLALRNDRNSLDLQMSRTRVFPRFDFPFTVKVWSDYCIRNDTGIPLSFSVVPDVSEFEEVSSAAIQIVTADEDGDQATNANRQVVMPHKSEVFSPLKGSEKCGIRIAVKDSCWTAKIIPLVPGGDILHVKAFSPYSSLVYSIIVSVMMHDQAPTTLVCCKPHLVCSNLTGKLLSLCTGEGMEGHAQEVEIDGRGVEIHCNDKEHMRLRVKVDGYLWSNVFDVNYPNGPNKSLVLESDDLRCAKILTVNTKLESPGCMHILFTSFNLLDYAPPYSVVNFSSESLMCRKAHESDAPWNQIDPYTSYVPTFAYRDSGSRMDGSLAIEIKAKDAPSRVYTLFSSSDEEKDFSIENEEEEADLQLDNGQNTNTSTRLNPLPINGYPGECAASLIKVNERSVKLLISTIFKMKEEDTTEKHYYSPSHSEFTFNFAAEYIDISIVNSVPKELAMLTVKGISFSLCDGIGMHNEKMITSLEIADIELDDMLAITPYEVVVKCSKVKKRKPFISLVLHQFKKTDLEPKLHLTYSELHVGRPIEVEVSERLVWAIMNFVESISLNKLEQKADNVYVDPDMQIDILSVAGLAAHISFMADANSRPKKLNMVSKFGLNFANIDNMPISILKRWEIRNLKVKQSVFMRVLFSRISRDISKQILPILFSGLSLSTVSNVTTGAISSIASAAATLSMDDKFESSRSKKSAPVGDLADGLVSGGESLAKGLVSGISGIFTKPIEGAKKQGAKGFAKGFAKGIIGVATKPISGALDMVSKSVEGGLASIDGVKSIASTEAEKKRLRYPRAFLGDRVLRPYNAYTAQGQHIFRTSLVSGNLEELQLTNEINPFTADFYEHHEPLPSDRVFVITDQRVMSVRLGTKKRVEGGKIVWSHPLSLITGLNISNDNVLVVMTLKDNRNVVCQNQNQARRLIEKIGAQLQKK